jgi:hypothetical protein
VLLCNELLLLVSLLSADTVLMQRVFCDNQEGVLGSMDRSSSSRRQGSRANSPLQEAQQQQQQQQQQAQAQQQRHPLE